MTLNILVTSLYSYMGESKEDIQCAKMYALLAVHRAYHQFICLQATYENYSFSAFLYIWCMVAWHLHIAAWLFLFRCWVMSLRTYSGCHFMQGGSHCPLILGTLLLKHLSLGLPTARSPLCSDHTAWLHLNVPDILPPGLCNDCTNWLHCLEYSSSWFSVSILWLVSGICLNNSFPMKLDPDCLV